MKIHCARTSSKNNILMCSQPRETQSREAMLQDPQGWAVQPQLSTSTKSTQYRPVHPPREQLKTEFHTIIQVKLNIWQFCLGLLLFFPVSSLCLVLDGTDSKMGFGHRPLGLYLQYLFVGFSIFKMMDAICSLLFSSGGGRHLFGISIAWKSQCFLPNIHKC